VRRLELLHKFSQPLYPRLVVVIAQ
jgi:hypothetical protein